MTELLERERLTDELDTAKKYAEAYFDESELLKKQVAKLRAALELHHAIAELDRNSGDDTLWTPQYEEACEAARTTLANEQDK